MNSVDALDAAHLGRAVPAARWLASHAILRAVGGAVLFGVVALLLGQHVRHMLAVPGVADDNYCGLVDFRDQAYYPVRALLDGNNPYDAEHFMRTYPAVKVFAPYSPVLLVLFLPFGLLPLEQAQLAYFLFNLGLVLVLARLALRLSGWPATAAQVFGAATLILVSRPGEWNALLGQFAVLGCVATYVALVYGETRPWLAGIGLAASLFKPTFGVPVVLLMLARRDRRAVVIGVGIATLVSLAVTAVLVQASGGLVPFARALATGYAAWRAESGDPLHTVYRVDAAALVARLLGRSPGMAVEMGISIALLGCGCVLLRRVTAAASGERRSALAASMGALIVLTAVYHLLYDLLLLVLPIAWVARRMLRRGRMDRSIVYGLILALLSFPMMNYLASERAATLLGTGSLLWQVGTASNACAPLLGLMLWAVVALRAPEGDA